MAIVWYLVDTLKLNPNARNQPPGCRLGNFWGRPLHYVAHNGGVNGDLRAVTLFLLERGANPELLCSEGGMTPMMYGKGLFLDVVNEWRSRNTGGSGKSKAADDEHVA